MSIDIHDEIAIEPRVRDLMNATVESLHNGTLGPATLERAMTLAYRCGWVTGKLKGLDRGLQELEGLGRNGMPCSLPGWRMP